MTTIRTYADHATDRAEIGPHQPKPTAVTDGLTEASTKVWESGKITTGLWESGAGSFTATREGYTEICTILSGKLTLEVEGQEPEDFGPGDIMVMPSGWVGIWHVHEPVRKHFTTILD